MKALYFEHFGDNSVLQFGVLDNPEVKANEILVKTKYIGLNFADIYRRRGNYHIEEHDPYINGYEGFGTVVKLGKSSSGLALGDKVLFVDVPFANAELVTVPTDKVIKLPTKLNEETAAAIGLQGLTADFLAHDLAKNKKNDNVFIQGISGGVGQILLQMLVADGVKVYGATSSEKKQKLALEQGATAVYLRTDNGTGKLNNKFETVFDGVGKTLEQSIKLTKHKGKVIFFGMAGGDPAKVDMVKLLAHSKSIMTGDLWDYLTSQDERQTRFNRLAAYFVDGKIKINKPRVFPLAEGKKAYDLLESGQSNGKILMQCD
ncbi:quinone oxidoreductase [Liquorilactobacillus sucicola DSM 21376 = JCM 15457]|uniref:Oxidoreductase n=1 Tax=Liquorilactobacillus sucicola DSM 21376 = JCM 15457 TaxID=1423806 RepID=A0A023CVU3_9LACO|nr:zinc-binding dehydrogenase [Liquorilactobacillus sucicola]KRN05584.1 oxidoreductase [Liquorilactobacillus sucicola DSM 21376 = JCM 15457]GAJ25671.1 quinone oxidoreductase [Liquorilactobacillus sucicola DSM 21376 = JCM 15457]